MKEYYLLLFLFFLVACKHPYIYEINTRAWLYELSKKYDRQILKISDIPTEEYDNLRDNGVDIVWMMGIWKLGKYGLEFDRKNGDYSHLLPDFRPDDIIGSPFAITEYSCNHDIGTDSDLKELRRQLNSRGIKLMLDFIPNHSAFDANYVNKYPDMYINAPEGVQDTNRYNSIGIAYGSDIGYKPWKDVAQLNIWNKKTREYMVENFLAVLTYADAVRCDVAYLVLNDVFEETWKYELEYYNYTRPDTEFWTEAFKAGKELNPEAIFLAELYEGKYTEILLELGFTYVYDKTLLDKLVMNAQDVKEYIKSKNNDFWKNTCHYVENHDEERIVFKTGSNYQKAKAAGTIAATVGGMIFMQHGQWEGKKNRLDVHLRRAAEEEDNAELVSYYKHLNNVIREPAFRGTNTYFIENMRGEKQDDFIAYIREDGDSHFLVVVNYSENKGCANVPIYNVKGYRYSLLHEAINDVEYVKSLGEVKNGMRVCLDAWESQIFQYNY